VLHLNRNDNGVIAITTTTMDLLLNQIKPEYSSHFVEAFQIFKENRTSDWVTILIPKSDYSKQLIQKKMEFYIQLGYSVK
jgi:hypothetical protein